MYDAVYSKRNFAAIANYEPNHHHTCFYYFRLGAAAGQDGKPDVRSSRVIIPKNGFVRIWSLETFKLSERVLGLFGPNSELIIKGLQLVTCLDYFSQS